MRSPLSTIPTARYTQRDNTDFDIAGGAAGWIDTDASALGIYPDRLWVIGVNVVAGQFSGVRPHGSALQPFKFTANSITLLSRTDSAGHFDLYREASNAKYTILGYFE